MHNFKEPSACVLLQILLIIQEPDSLGIKNSTVMERVKCP